MMIIYILIAMVVGVVALVTTRARDKFGVAVFGTVICSLVAVALFLGLNSVTRMVVGSHWSTYETAELASIDDRSGTSGSFFLGSGQIDSTPVFYYYEHDKDGYRLKHQDASEAVVVESGKPYIEYRHLVSNDSNWYLEWGGTSVIFHVPEGSIVRDFTLGR
jgi:hypothetical protein